MVALLLAYFYLPAAYASNRISIDSSSWYDAVLENNLQKRQDWEGQKNEWMNPDNFLSMNDSEMKKLSDEIVKECTDDYEKIKAIHDWVCNNIYYDYDGFGFTTIEVKNDEEAVEIGNMSAYELLMTYRRGKCWYYSSIFSTLVRAQGIPCMTVSGFAAHDNSILAAKSTNHEWNQAFVDNRWIIVDTTWDSGNAYSDGKYIGGGSSDKYFDISDTDFAHDHKIMEYSDVHKYSIVQQIAITGGETELSAMQAFPGQMVTITVKPETGYQLGELDVISDNNRVPVTQQAGTDNQYTFIMPGGNTTVLASFFKN